MPGDKEVTIYDIARHLAISATTVSRGLQNNPMVNKNTRKKILEAARALGYRSNTFASSLRSRQTHTIGVLVPRLNSYFMSSVLAGMENAATAEGYNLIIAQSLEDMEKEKANAATMFNKRVDGLLVSLAYNTADMQHFEPFFKRKIPVVFFDRVFPHAGSTSISIDNQQAAYSIVSHLAEQGCKKIMHLGGSLLRNVYRERFEGYRQALAAHQLPFYPEWHLVSGLSEDAGTDAANYILELPPEERPDAVFAANDTAAAYCLLAVKKAGLRVPGDIAFAGFNNDPISKIIEPNLTTVDYPGHIIGQSAVTSLVNHLKGAGNLYFTNNIILRHDILIRASSLKNAL